ncbi:hypothetical protein H5410_064857 [Solanum commersonii]|uniref:Non-specific lipid-transfer protein n=1 Tax=Solanum commersonii TaxID=4109 RepID=A0A9J5VYI6_SOLCO|nr:hypothetical protein H5410_064857 [Solanum commersonii]
MEIVSKIVCFVFLCMVVVAPHAEAMSCSQVSSSLAPCVPYLQGRGPLGGCCVGVKSLYGAAKTPADRRTACTCIKTVANAVMGLDTGRAAGLPSTCGVNIPYDISPSVDCSNTEMVGKIACIIVLCMVAILVAPHAQAAMTCGRGPSEGAVAELGSFGCSQDSSRPKMACNCLKSAATAIKGIDAGKAAGIPSVCGVNIPYKISPSTDCTSKADDQCNMEVAS